LGNQLDRGTAIDYRVSNAALDQVFGHIYKTVTREDMGAAKHPKIYFSSWKNVLDIELLDIV